jgi:hypothetical protein
MLTSSFRVPGASGPPAEVADWPIAAYLSTAPPLLGVTDWLAAVPVMERSDLRDAPRDAALECSIDADE